MAAVRGGNAVTFIQEKEGLNFPEAIRWLAKRYNITLEESGYSVDPQKADKEKEYRRVIKSIANQYRQQYIQLAEDTPAKKEIKKRQLTDNEVIEWQISYAPDNWQFITNLCIQNGVWTPAEELHFVKKGVNGNHDQFHNRIIFPVYDHNGQLVTFAGQALTEKDKKQAKYINGSETALYKKSFVLYGLDKAKPYIQKANTAIVVEGYYDVIAMHRFAMNNTCGTCGTSLTSMHVKLLSRWAKRVVFIFDSDNPGFKAALKSIDLALAGGLHPAVCFFPEGEDPDSFARQLQGVDEGEENALQKYVRENQQDGVFWKAKHLIDSAGDDVLLKADAQNEICLLLAKVSDEFRRKEYIKNISKQLKLEAKAIERFVKGEIDRKHRDEEIDEDDIALPQGVDRNEFLLHGFYGFVKGDETGYFFAGNGRETTKLTNFVIEPLYHVYSKEDNKRIIRINNGREEKLLQMESKGFISLDQFKSRMFEEGFFVTYGGFNAIHLSKIVGKIGRQFPFCYELTTLGWQPEGFFAFSNAIYNINEIQPFDERGIITHKGVNYFSPSASKITEGDRGDTNPYENDLYLTYQPSNKSFSDWAGLMQEAFDEKSMLATAFVFVTLFRDLVFKMENTCPMLYAYGQVQSGKSAFGQRISNLFFKDLLPFNLNQGTDFAFHNRLGRFRNCPAVYNEFDETAIKEEWFRALKAVYDGEGRERGKMGAKNKTEVQKPNSTVILLGQVLSTKDDGSVLSRCIIVEFKNVDKRPESQIKAFNTLIDWEKQGISGLLLQVLQHRPAVEKNCPKTMAV
ncbi:toprim domain-containing protein [Oscillatoria amoena NRMC-F 0135]|nr:toprim domain-containing protein [Oscillatoria amoena NRMC-F 0135]